MAKSDIVVGQEGISEQNAAESTMCAHQGFSGALSTGIVLTGTAHFDCLAEAGFHPRIVRVDVAGNLGFRTLDGNDHLVAMDAKSELRGIFVSRIYDASHATLATTCTGVHVF